MIEIAKVSTCTLHTYYASGDSVWLKLNFKSIDTIIMRHNCNFASCTHNTVDMKITVALECNFDSHVCFDSGQHDSQVWFSSLIHKFWFTSLIHKFDSGSQVQALL